MTVQKLILLFIINYYVSAWTFETSMQYFICVVNVFCHNRNGATIALDWYFQFFHKTCSGITLYILSEFFEYFPIAYSWIIFLQWKLYCMYECNWFNIVEISLCKWLLIYNIIESFFLNIQDYLKFIDNVSAMISYHSHVLQVCRYMIIKYESWLKL